MGCFRNLVERRFIAKARWSASRVREELLGEAAGKVLGVLGVELFPSGEVSERLAFGGGAGGIDFSTLVVLAVGTAQQANSVVVFEGEAGWVDGLVATGAAFVVAVFVELVADAGGSADVGLDSRNAGWWWWDVVAENALIDENAAHDG